MNKNSRFSVTFVTMFFIVSSFVMAYDTSKSPVAISPGSDLEVAVVEQNCPTFSWSGVEGATAYRIAIFEAVTTEVQAYKDMEMMAPLVIDKEIQGPALSWTPSSDEGLKTGGVYVWYVRAVDMSGFGEWSTGKKFRVEASPGLPGLKENLKKRLKEFGVEAGVVDEVFKGIQQGEKEGDLSGEGTKAVGSGNTVSRALGSEGDSHRNVYYGDLAGDSLSGYDNAFFGYAAGNLTSNGEMNTFMGTYAGNSNTGGINNTYIGFKSGKTATGSCNTYVGSQTGWGEPSNTGDYNTFLGFGSGCNNTNGDRNVFLGCQSGVINQTGDGNVFIGYNAGYYSSAAIGSVFLGYEAGYLEGGSNRLYIENSSSSSPLIYGEFDNNLVKINGNFRVTGYLSLDNGSTQINSTEINILDGKTLQTGGSVDNDKLVTKGYVDASDDVGGGLTGAFMTHQKICKWDDGGTRLVDSILSESSGAINVNGKLGVGVISPIFPLQIETIGTDAVFMAERDSGAIAQIAARSNKTMLGSRSNHRLNLCVNNTPKVTVDTNGWVGISDTTPDYPLDMGTVGNNARCTTGGAWQNGSSRASKENIQDLTVNEAMNALNGLNPVRFNYKVEKTEEYVGFIAEDVPELVATNDRKALGTMDIMAVLTKVVQYQQNVLKDQQKTIAELKKEIAELKKK